MASITNGTDCGLKGDYLAWNPSQWEATKDHVRYFEIDDKDLCFFYGTKRLVRIPHQYETDAIKNCMKLGNSQLPNVESDEALNGFNELARLEDIFTIAENKKSIRYVWTPLPYLYVAATNSYWNVYEDYGFNTTSAHVYQWQINQGKDGSVWNYDTNWYLFESNSIKLPATCVTEGLMLLRLIGV